MRQLRNRIKAGVMALALTLAQIVVPAAPAFASNNGTLKVHEIGTPSGTESNDPKVCAFNFEGFGFDPQQEGYINLEAQGGSAPIGTNSGNYVAGPASSTGYFVTQDFNVAGGVQIPNGTYKATMYGKGGAATNQNEKAKSKVFKVDCAPQSTTVTAVNGSFTDLCGPTFNASFTAASTAGVTYVPAVTGNTITVTATADAGYALTNPNFTQSYTDLLVACPTPDKQATAVNGTFADKCGDSFNLIFTAATTEGVTYVQIRNGNTITVTATANAGYVLTEPNWSQAQTDLLLACPVITPCPETSTSIVSKYEEFADYNETRAMGHAEFTEDGLRVYTEGATSTDKVAWYNIVNPYSLQDVGAPAIDYIDSTATTNDEPGMQLLLDFDGNGSTDGILVGEKVYGDNWWLTNGSKAFVKAGAPHNGSGNGSQWYGTLNEWLAAYPNAQVTVVGFSLGSGVKGDGLLKSLTFGCQTWVFKKVVKKVTVCPAGNLPIVRSTDADKNGWTIPATAQYQAEGGIKLVVGGNWEESYISRSVDALIADIGTIVDFTATPSQYVGIHVVTSKGVLVYEKEASYGGKWWSTGDFGVNGGLGYATLDTLDNIVAANPDLKMSEIRVLYTSPDASNTVISSVKIGCVEYLFNKTGGSGGVVPTTPEIPATPVVPTSPAASAKAQTAPVGGQGSLPAELSMTGVNGSVLSTWIALLAAILTYGAVFYLQPKKRFEQ